jgi:hypothetical protein
VGCPANFSQVKTSADRQRQKEAAQWRPVILNKLSLARASTANWSDASAKHWLPALRRAITVMTAVGFFCPSIWARRPFYIESEQGEVVFMRKRIGRELPPFVK